ncbi:hypothetical protein INT43_007740 [Umbelopsis isabellina]|uniref:Exosome complex protein n=1 Tax=Mortierella isabellina TaxID=91625 RepID=A0A8H7UF56_MORIS|nr:hypothetical protein INT43_007740 [Umbelopsis isabellina]
MADSMATEAPTAVVQALNTRLDTITKLLEPLVCAPLNETVGKLSTLERCQLYVLLSYTLNTTIFIYLKTQGENPKEHAVIRELERVTQYVGKIKAAQGSKKSTLTVDKAAAHRFVKGALSGNPDQKKETDEHASTEDGEISSAEEATPKAKKRGGEKMSSSKKKKRGIDPFSGK